MGQYVADGVALLRYLVDALPAAADEVFARAVDGVDVVYAPQIAVAETLYQVAFGDTVAGVELQGNPNGAYRHLVTNGPVAVAPADEHVLAVYASLVELYRNELHDALVAATHRVLDTEAVISKDEVFAENGVELVWR